ncbi:MAG: MmgE/PrpD family protein [Chloroflexi bacterium]|nr:MmgE/PrpD family protein [Chloroflexota bacterium]
MEGKYTRGLSEFVADLKFEDLPRDVVERMKLLVLDTVGAGLLGAGMPWSVRMRNTVEDMEAPGDGSIWGTQLRFSAPTAALVNGTAVHGFEIDDVGAGGHNGSVTLTSILPLAQHRGGLSGKDVITATTAGIEVAARVGKCVGGIPHTGMGFHGPGLMGTFASAGSSAKALKLSADQCVDTLGHAGQQAASLMFTHHGGMGKRMLAGQAARAGVFGALLAANGYTNAPNVFEAEYGGFPAAHTGNRRPPAYDLNELTKALGTDWQSRGVNFKMWACRVPNHATLEAIRGLRKQHDIRADDIGSVEIRLGKGSYQNVGWAYTPTTITSAQLNLYYVSSLMLLENDVFVEQFTGGKISSPRVLDMISRVKVMHDPDMDDNGYTGTPVKIAMRNGTIYETVGHVRGSGGDDPITKDDVLTKFRKMTQPFWSEATQDRAISLCENLENLEDTTELTSLLEIEHLPPVDMGGE